MAWKRDTAGLLEHDYQTEGEGDLDAAAFRASHLGYWTRVVYEISEDTPVVLLYFDLV